MTSDRLQISFELLDPLGSRLARAAAVQRRHPMRSAWSGALVLLTLGGCPGSGSGTSETDTETGIGSLTNQTSALTEGVDESTQGASETGLPTCGESEFVLQVAPTRVMLVLDKSGSMVTNTWDHDDDPITDEITTATSTRTRAAATTTATGRTAAIPSSPPSAPTIPTTTSRVPGSAVRSSR